MAVEEPATQVLPEGRRPQYILQYFNYKHLNEPMRSVSAHFTELAAYIYDTVPDGPEQTVALRKLLESKDAAVRAIL